MYVCMYVCTGADPRNYNESVLNSKAFNAVNTIENRRLQDMMINSDLKTFLGEGIYIHPTMNVCSIRYYS